MSTAPSYFNNVPATLRCWSEIDLGALRRNADLIAAHVGEGRQVMAVVKADAYGHGVGAVGEALAGRVALFGVANLDEARQLREAVPGARVLLLSPVLPTERCAVAAEGFEVCISDREDLEAFAALGTVREPVRVHLAVDTGMGRMGVWETEAPALLRQSMEYPGIHVVAVGTHLPSADVDADFTRAQLERYQALVAQLRQIFPGLGSSHALNSAGILGFSEFAGDLVLAGLVLYGLSPLPVAGMELLPVASMKSRVVLVRSLGPGRGVCYGRTFVTTRTTRAATVCAGYGDGYPRHVSGSGVEVLIRGRRCAVLGRVTMDQLVVDVTDVGPVERGDEVVLMGRQGEEEIRATELAERAGTIPWEILTGMQCRGGRVYFNAWRQSQD